MSKKKPNYLVDTAVARAPIGDLGSLYMDYFTKETAGAKLWTSTYIRMECIRRWVLSRIRVAIYIDLYNDIGEAFIRLEQRFSSRDVKADLSTLRDYVANRGPNSPRDAAEEIGRLAVHWLRRFDRVFRSRIDCASGCRLGRRPLRADYDSLLEDLSTFYHEFTEPVTDCEVNEFLAFTSAQGRAARLLKDDRIPMLKPVGKWLDKYCSEKRTITCIECMKLGDAIIALAQQKAYTLLSTDSSFEILCEVLDRKFRQLRSPISVHREHVPEIGE